MATNGHARSVKSSSASLGPLFIAGVPRSGTHALAHLIARHSGYAMIPRELGFHTGFDEAGLPELLNGRISLNKFVDLMSDYWWKRPASWDSGITRGLHKTIPEVRFRRCLERFSDAYPSNALRATREFMHELLDPIAAEAGKAAWIEMDPANLLVASLLYRIFPDMKLIHIMRDGRDVAQSTCDLPWGRGGTMTGGIRVWQRMLREGHTALRELPTERVLTIQLEDLVANRREYTYTRILEFLGLLDETSMHAFFDEKISAENAHVGRWRSVLSRPQQLGITTVYGCALARLAMAGVSSRPALQATEHAFRPVDITRRPQRETVDPWADGVAKDA